VHGRIVQGRNTGALRGAAGCRYISTAGAAMTVTSIQQRMMDAGIDPQVADELAGTYPHDLISLKLRKLVGRRLDDPGRFLAKVLAADAAAWYRQHQRPSSPFGPTSAFDSSCCDPAAAVGELTQTAADDVLEDARRLARLHFPNTEKTRPIVEANFVRALIGGASEKELIERFGSNLLAANRLMKAGVRDGGCPHCIAGEPCPEREALIEMGVLPA